MRAVFPLKYVFPAFYSNYSIYGKLFYNILENRPHNIIKGVKPFSFAILYSILNNFLKF